MPASDDAPTADPSSTADATSEGAVCATPDRCSEQHSYGPGCLLATSDDASGQTP